MFIGLDIGTTNCKSIVFADDGTQLGSAADGYPVVYPHPGYAEQDAELVWQKTKNVLFQSIKNINNPTIKALSVSVQGDAVIAVDTNLIPLLPTQLGMDYRAQSQTNYCIKLFGRENLFTITGMPPHPLNSLSKILWLKDEKPAIFKKTWKFMTYADLILSKLGAQPFIDFTMASRTMAFDLAKKDWSDQILDTLGIPNEKLSTPVPSGKIIGKISKHLAKELGLNPDVLLVTGGHDQTCAALGAGITKPGKGVISTGTAEVFSSVLPEEAPDPQMLSYYYPCYIYTLPDFYFTFALNHSGGIVYQWFRDQCCKYEKYHAVAEGTNIYSLIDKNLPSEPTHLFVLPHFNGSGAPTCDLQSKGAILGLTLGTTREEIAKAIMEGLSFELKINIETMESIGINNKELIAVGGGAKSPEWLQIKADVTNLPIRTLKNKDSACVGAGILAATAFTKTLDIEVITDTFVKYERFFEPREPQRTTYQKKYKIYKHLYNNLLKLNKMIT